MNFAEWFASFFLDSSGPNADKFIVMLRDGCNVAPEFISWVLLYVELLTEKMGNKEVYWALWRQLSERVQSIAIEIADHKGQGYLHDKRTKLIRKMLHADAPWQKVDYENKDIAIGKELILDFVKNAGSNPDVFEAMASLMYHFPSVFLESGLYLLAKHQRNTAGVHLFSRVNTAYYLESCMQRFLLTDNTEPMSNDLYQSCWTLLDAIVEKASSVAYYLREHLIRSRRITKVI